MSDASVADSSSFVVENDRLKAEALRFSSIVNVSENPIWQHDANVKICFFNLAFSELAEDILSDDQSLADIELFKGHHDMVRAALFSSQPQISERYVIIEGKRRLYRIREVPTGDGTVTGFAVDITETDKARDEIQRHISAQQDFLESSTNAMAIFAKDQTLQFYNFGFVSLWRLDEHFLDSRPTYGEILEVLRENRRLPEQSNFPAFKQQHLKYFTDLIEPHEEFFYLPDGKILRVVMVPHALGGLLLAYEDVTDRLALERSYNTLIAVQRETLDNLDEGVLVIGEDGRVKLTNPTYDKMWGLKESALNQEPHLRELMDMCSYYYNVEDWERYKNECVVDLQKRQTESGKYERADATVLRWRKVPLPDGGVLFAYSDVTDSTLLERSLRDKNEALEAADKLKTEFLANMSYELRSPLTSISGFSDILRNQYFGELNEKQQEYIEGIHQSSQQLSSLIGDILDLATIEAGFMQLDITEFDMFAMIESVMHLLKERVRVMDITIRNFCDSEIGTICADETRLRQVLLNLLSNAVKYSHAGGEVRIQCYPSCEELICLRVEDDGVGIEAESQAEVFERFYRAGATKGQQSGSGLGLSIVRSFVELHGGTVSLESTPGEGTSFTCMIPRAPR